MASEDTFTNNLVLRLVRDEAKSAPCLPGPQPTSHEQKQLEEKMAKVIKDVSFHLDRQPDFNNMVDEFARVANIQSFLSLANRVFDDGITWGKIFTLLCVIGRVTARMIVGFVSSIVDWTMYFFKGHLQAWINSNGGWINSISSLFGIFF